jgi:hypothetical protein
VHRWLQILECRQLIVRWNDPGFPHSPRCKKPHVRPSLCGSAKPLEPLPPFSSLCCKGDLSWLQSSASAGCVGAGKSAAARFSDHCFRLPTCAGFHSRPVAAVWHSLLSGRSALSRFLTILGSGSETSPGSRTANGAGAPRFLGGENDRRDRGRFSRCPKPNTARGPPSFLPRRAWRAASWGLPASLRSAPSVLRCRCKFPIQCSTVA